MAQSVAHFNLNDLVEGFLTWRLMVRERVPLVEILSWCLGDFGGSVCCVIACFSGENGNNLKSGVLFAVDDEVS